MADKPRNMSLNIPPIQNHVPVLTAVTIESGDAVGKTSAGYHRPLDTADDFAGFAKQRVVNAGASGDRNCLVVQQGEIELDVVGVDGVDDKGATVYALGPNTFTLSSSSSAKSIGKITKHISGTRCMVYFEAVPVRSI